VTIHLRCMFRRLHLVVSEDSRQVVPSAHDDTYVPRGKSRRDASIASIRARLHRLDGEMRIASRPSGRARLHAVVPMQPAIARHGPRLEGVLRR